LYRFTEPDDLTSGGAERLDRSPVLSTLFGALIFLAFLVQYLPQLKSLNLTPDMLNFFMLGLAVLLHGSIRSFLQATQEAIGDTAGILIQFPLYFGIMGIMTESGLIHQISDFFVTISNERTFPVFTFFSAGLVNIFVPSGGGQWAVQGPVILEAAQRLGVSLPKAVLALSYGDQLTNMLQPFWALPLLGITRLKAREILPYTLLFMVVGGVIFLTGLWFS
jgi:short-chain fatty acids transporter